MMGDNREPSTTTAEKTLELLTALNKKVQDIESRMGAMEGARGAGSSTVLEPQDVDDSEDDDHEQPPQITPQSIRNDRATMDNVAERLAEWGLGGEGWSTGGPTLTPWRQATKKSGAITKGNDNIKTIIDWPHFHIRQGPRRTMPTFEELSSNEFALGFVRMIRDPASKLDTKRMLEILTEVLEDSIDFGWENARNYYLMIGQEIEQSRITWSDRQRMLQLRMTYSRIVLPPVSANNPKATNATRAKCCAPYQHGECDKEGDHAQFKHACDFCYRVKSKLFPHAERDCRSKKYDSSKNGQTGDRE